MYKPSKATQAPRKLYRMNGICSLTEATCIVAVVGIKIITIATVCSSQNFANDFLFSLIPSNLLSFHKATTLKNKYVAILIDRNSIRNNNTV
jgi:hypothetical protein